jgi:transposase
VPDTPGAADVVAALRAENMLTYYFLGDRDLASFKGFIYSDLHAAVVVHDRYQNDDSFDASATSCAASTCSGT